MPSGNSTWQVDLKDRAVRVERPFVFLLFFRLPGGAQSYGPFRLYRAFNKGAQPEQKDAHL